MQQSSMDTDDSYGCTSHAQALYTARKTQLCCEAEPLQQSSMDPSSTEQQMLCQPMLKQCLHTQAKSSSCARSPLTLPGRLVFALASLARLQRTAGWARTADCPAAAGCRAMFCRSEAPPCQRPRSPQLLSFKNITSLQGLRDAWPLLCRCLRGCRFGRGSAQRKIAPVLV